MNLNLKSELVSFLLTFFFGPVGLFYSSFAGGVALLLLTAATFPTVIGPIICWFLSIVIGMHCTSNHNYSVKKFISIHK